MKKRDIYIIGIVLVIVCLFFAINYITDQKKTESVDIYVNNKLYKRLPIDANTQVKVKNKGQYNIVKIHDRGAEMVEASCPDKVCVNTGFINRPSQRIVCVPNKVTVVIRAEKQKDGIDFISK